MTEKEFVELIKGFPPLQGERPNWRFLQIQEAMQRPEKTGHLMRLLDVAGERAFSRFGCGLHRRPCDPELAEACDLGAIPIIREEASDALGNRWTDSFDRFEGFDVGVEQGVEVTEVARDEVGDRLAHVANSECNEKSTERR